MSFDGFFSFKMQGLDGSGSLQAAMIRLHIKTKCKDWPQAQELKCSGIGDVRSRRRSPRSLADGRPCASSLCMNDVSDVCPNPDVSFLKFAVTSIGHGPCRKVWASYEVDRQTSYCCHSCKRLGAHNDERYYHGTEH